MPGIATILGKRKLIEHSRKNPQIPVGKVISQQQLCTWIRVSLLFNKVTVLAAMLSTKRSDGVTLRGVSKESIACRK